MTVDRRARGDWPTPAALADAILARLVATDPLPAAVLEPTCGAGAFLRAARRAVPGATLHGYELDAEHHANARRAVPEAALHAADAFAVDWRAVVGALPAPCWIVGNPPWVTASTLGTLGQKAPVRPGAARGLDARTGRANRDVAETLILAWLDAARARPGPFTLAMLCKASTARRVFEHILAHAWPLTGTLTTVDARAAFGVAVEAVLLHVRPAAAPATSWPVYPSLDAPHPTRALAACDGFLTGDRAAFEATRALTQADAGDRPWRSGVKHDAAPVLELVRRDGALWNGAGARVDVEEDVLYPLAKGGDLDHGRAAGSRFLLLPQHALGDDPAATWPDRFPRAWAYLQAHRARFQARRSAIYRGRPDYAVFGLGPYTFAPHKVAVSALGKAFRFRALGPVEGRPVLVDDTSYLWACQGADEAAEVATFLNGPDAQAFLRARTFADAKRPLGRRVLDALTLPTVAGTPKRVEDSTSRTV